MSNTEPDHYESLAEDRHHERTHPRPDRLLDQHRQRQVEREMDEIGGWPVNKLENVARAIGELS